MTKEPSLDLPFVEYVDAAIKWNKDRLEDNERWLTPLWEFTRLIRGHPQVRELPKEQVLDRVEEAFRDLGQDWMFLDVDDEDAQVEFLHAWDKVRYAPGYGPLEIAMDRAAETPLATNRSKASPERYMGYNQFVSIAGWLQVILGNTSILLPCRKLAEKLGRSEMTISRYRDWAIEDRFLRVVGQHQFSGGPGKGMATRFRFNVAIWPVLAAAADEDTRKGFNQEAA